LLIFLLIMSLGDWDQAQEGSGLTPLAFAQEATAGDREQETNKPDHLACYEVKCVDKEGKTYDCPKEYAQVQLFNQFTNKHGLKVVVGRLKLLCVPTRKEHKEDKEAEWCSPGFWRNNADKHDANQWPVPTTTLYNAVISTPSVPGNPTLLDVLHAPQTYGGAAFNAVADYLSAQADLNFTGERTDNCPLDQHG
jgi:hypothetical protein